VEWANFRLIGNCLLLAVNSIVKNAALIWTKLGWATFGRFVKKLIGHPDFYASLTLWVGK
jgi:hypothetical protein